MIKASKRNLSPDTSSFVVFLGSVTYNTKLKICKLNKPPLFILYNIIKAFSREHDAFKLKHIIENFVPGHL